MKIKLVTIVLRIEVSDDETSDDACQSAVKMLEGKKPFPSTEITYECGGVGGFIFISAKSSCKHDDFVKLGEMADRFFTDWCRNCGAIRDGDKYSIDREQAVWVPPRNSVSSGAA